MLHIIIDYKIFKYFHLLYYPIQFKRCYIYNVKYILVSKYNLYYKSGVRTIKAKARFFKNVKTYGRVELKNVEYNNYMLKLILGG